MLYRADFVSTVGNIEVVNVFHIVTEAETQWLTDPNPTPSELADELNTHLQAYYRACLGANATFETIRVSTVTNPANPNEVPTVGEHAIGVAGARATGDPDLPAALCGHITWRTALSGRSFRGRSFMPPIEQSGEIQDNLLSPTGDYYLSCGYFADRVEEANLSGGSTWATLWKDTWTAKFVVYSPTRHAAGNTPFTADITAGIMRRDVGELRSRRP